jgi:hypothetical protein
MSKPHEKPGPSRIACALIGPAQRQRHGEWAALGRRALIARAAHPNGIRLRYCETGTTQAELERLIALEAECCTFLSFDLARAGEDRVLTVTGPSEALEIIRECWGKC